MSKKYLRDAKFLKALDEMRIKEHYINLQVMDFQEQPIRQIQGIATAGNITVNGQSAVRRTINLTLTALAEENDITNLNHIISYNKKIKVELGIRNPFDDYKFYGEIIWFPLGTYLVTEANSQVSATAATITLKGKDKMCLLDGTCGGVLPATVTFHETQVIHEDGNVVVEKVPIFTIIKECVEFYGQELSENIIINDIEMVAKQSMKYIGSTPIWFDEEFKLSPIISETSPNTLVPRINKYVQDQEVGYIETDFTFPGELVFSAGETVTKVLDKIIQTIGNYEYFYDLDGHFVFQEKKNYLNHYYTPVIDLNDSFYIRNFSDSKYYLNLQDAKDTISYFNTPKYENIKNDFVVWGNYTTPNGEQTNIQYHLAIDEKPGIDLANMYMWEKTTGDNYHLEYILDYKDEGYKNAPNELLIDFKCEEKLDSKEVKEKIRNHLNILCSQSGEYFIDDIVDKKVIDTINQLGINADNYFSKDEDEKYVCISPFSFGKYTNSTFILYVKVIQGNNITYYRAKIKDGAVVDGELFELYYYQDSILDELIVIGILETPEETTNNNSNNNLLPTPDGDSSWMDDENWTGPGTAHPSGGSGNHQLGQNMGGGISLYKPSAGEMAKKDTSSIQNKKATDENIDEDFSVYPPSSGESGGDKEENDNENTEKPKITKRIGNAYTALELKNENENYELGYYDKDKNWKKIYQFNNPDELTIKNLPNILSSIKRNNYVRVFVTKDFNKNNNNDFSFIDSANLNSSGKGDLKGLKDSNGNLIEFEYNFSDLPENLDIVISNAFYGVTAEVQSIVNELIKDYDWSADKAVENFINILIERNIELSDYQKSTLMRIKQIRMNSEQKEKMIKYILPFYIDNYSDCMSDLNTIWSKIDTKKGTLLITTPNGDSTWMDDENWTGPGTAHPSGGGSNNSGSSDGNHSLGQIIGGNIALYSQFQEQTNKTIAQQSEVLSNDLKVLKDKNLVNDIVNYGLVGKTIKELISEIYEYWSSNIIKVNAEDKNVLKIITYYPEEPFLDYSENIQYKKIGNPCNEWREELYRQALVAKETGTSATYYDEELISFWRQNFDTMNEEWHKEWSEFIAPDFIEGTEIPHENAWSGWNPNIYRDPGLLRYWLDFIDSDQLLSKYSVNNIGRRTKAIVKENVKVLYRLAVPDVLFIKNENIDAQELANMITEYSDYGQKYCLLKPNEMQNFSSATVGTTAFDLIREMLFTHLSFQTSVTINCTPKYYLEPNNLIYISNRKSGIQGDFFINQLTIPLTYNGTMSISTSQIVSRL